MKLTKVFQQQESEFVECSDCLRVKDDVNFVEHLSGYFALACFHELEAVGVDLQKIDLWGLYWTRHQLELEEAARGVL